jgi:hypothetical protein
MNDARRADGATLWGRSIERPYNIIIAISNIS